VQYAKGNRLVPHIFPYFLQILGTSLSIYLGMKEEKTKVCTFALETEVVHFFRTWIYVHGKFCGYCFLVSNIKFIYDKVTINFDNV
jgi:hypothetical protein